MTKFLNIILCSGAPIFWNLGKFLYRSSSINVCSVSKREFAGNEFQVSIPKIERTKTIIVQNLIDANTHFLELCYVIDILKNRGIEDLVVVIPYLAYSRQDKHSFLMDAPHLKTIAKILNMFELSKIIFCDIHNPDTVSLFENGYNLKFDDLFAKDILQDFKNRRLVVPKNCVIISPDAGSSERAKNLAGLLGCEYVSLNKKRFKNGLINISYDSDCSVFCQNYLIIIDDMIASGSTLCASIEFLRNYNPKGIDVCVTHVLYSAVNLKNLEKVDNLVYTGTMSRSQNLIPRSRMIDIAHKILEMVCV